MANFDENTTTDSVERDEVEETVGQPAVPLGPETRAIIILGRE